jgi:hypothetical protein
MISTLLDAPYIENSQVRHDTVKIMLERKLELNFDDIAFDYDENQKSDQPGILILLLLRKKLNQVKELLRAAKITPVNITNTFLGLNPAAGSGIMCHVLEYPSSFELCVFRDESLYAVQHLAKKSTQPLDPESARKITRQVSRICLSSGITDSVRYCIWGPDTPSHEKNQELGQIFGQVEFNRPHASSGHFPDDLAAELAGRTLRGTAERINFLNGRQDVQKTTVVTQWLRKAIALAAGIVILMGLFILSWYSDLRRISDYQQQLDSMKTHVQAAEQMTKQVSYARQWFQQKPDYLDMLRELTLCFPENNDIWISSLAVDESFNQVLRGYTVSKDAVLDVAEDLRARDTFDGIKILYIRNTGKGSDVMTFAINLQYRKDQHHGVNQP